MKPSQLLETLKIGIPKQRAFLLVSAPGVGKTDIGKQAAAAVDYECQVFHPVVSDPTDFKGMPWIYVKDKSNAPTAEFIPFGDLRRLLETKKPTLAFLDDLGQAPPLVQAATMQLLLARRINSHAVPDHVTFLAATNRREDKATVSGILEPVKSRFVSILTLEVDVEDWILWAIRENISPVVRAFIRARPNLLFDFKPSGDMVNSPLPRTAVHVAKLYEDKYPPEVEYELYQGAAGEGFAVEFLAFAKIFRKLVSPKKVIQDPDGFQIPKEPDVLYALCGAVANLSSEDNMKSIVRFAERLANLDEFEDNMARAEFAVLLIRDSCNHDGECRNTRDYIEWQSKNPDIVV
jgi:hypothetical protein